MVCARKFFFDLQLAPLPLPCADPIPTNFLAWPLSLSAYPTCTGLLSWASLSPLDPTVLYCLIHHIALRFHLDPSPSAASHPCTLPCTEFDTLCL